MSGIRPPSTGDPNSFALRPVQAGDKFYHVDLGPVEVTGVRDQMLDIVAGGRPMNCFNNPKLFLPFGSEEARSHLAEHAEERYKYLPVIAAVTYFKVHTARYRALLPRIVKQELPSDEVISFDGIRDVLRFCRIYMGKSRGKAYNSSGWDYIFSLSNDTVCRRLLTGIYELAGDDLIELGFRRFRHSMHALLFNMLKDSRHKPAQLAHLRDDVMKYYAQKGLSVASLYSSEEQETFYRVFSCGDYDRDKNAYDALRNNDQGAIAGWTDSIVQLLQTNPQLAGVNLLIPVLGREKQGWPVAALAERVGVLAGVMTYMDLWKPRPEDVLPSEAGLTFDRKEDQAARSHRLRRGARKMIDGRTVAVVDDNITTGATWRAVAGALRAAGAKDVFLLAATRTNRK